MTLAPGATSTTVSLKNGNRNAEVLLSPRTASAAAVVTTTFATMVDASSMLISHANSGVTDRTFSYLIIGG